MTTTTPLTGARNGTRIALVLLELLIGLNAVWGGVMLMTDSWKLAARCEILMFDQGQR